MTKPSAEVTALSLPATGEKPHRSVVFFVSFDLVDSTRFKGLRKDWPVTIAGFYTTVIAKTSTWTDVNLQVWKYAGDEVICRAKLTKNTNVSSLVRQVHHTLIELADELSSTMALSVKATAWVAEVVTLVDASGPVASDHYKNSNVVFSPQDGVALDYLGPEIDIGFRMGTFAERALLTVSIELALLLEGNANIRLCGHHELKGVWDGAPYPILYYANDWEKVRSHLRYQDELKSTRLTCALGGGMPVSGGTFKHLGRILDNVHTTERYDQIKITLEDTPQSVEMAPPAPPPDDATCTVPDGTAAA
jgi:hypothetical protein